MEKANQWFVQLSLLMLPSFYVIYESALSIYFGVVLLWAVACKLTIKERRPYSDFEKGVIAVLIAFALCAVFSLFIKGINERGIKDTGYILRLITVWPFLSILSRCTVKVEWLLIGLASMAFSFGVYAIYDIYICNYTRATGDTDSILFGDFSTLSASFSCFIALHLFRKKKYLYSFLAAICFVFGFYASVLSGTRGAWILLPFIVIGSVMYIWKIYKVKSHAKVYLLFAVVALMLPPFLMYNSSIKDRVGVAFSNIESYEPGKSYTSLGLRFDAWFGAYDAFQENPILGAGMGKNTIYTEKGIKEGKYHPGANLDDAHSDYFFVLSSRGFIGVISYMLLLGYPLVVFFRVFNGGSLTQVLFASFGIALVVGYAFFGVTITMLVRSQAIYLFVLCVGSFIYFIEESKDEKLVCVNKSGL